MSYTDAHLDSSFGQGQHQTFSGNVQSGQQQQPYAHLNTSFGQGQCQMFSGNVQPDQQRLEPPYNASLNSSARYAMTPTTPSFPNQVPSTPVRNQAETISPFTPPQIHKDSQGDEIPKSLNYDPTKKPWEVFNQEFCRHARNKYWTSMECKSNFMYLLEGEAAEYVAVLNQREPDLQFFDLLSKMINSKVGNRKKLHSRYSITDHRTK